MMLSFVFQDDQVALLAETVLKVIETVTERTFRNVVLDLLLKLFSELNEPDFVSMCQCLIKLEKPVDVVDILYRLVQNPVKCDYKEVIFSHLFRMVNYWHIRLRSICMKMQHNSLSEKSIMHSKMYVNLNIVENVLSLDLFPQQIYHAPAIHGDNFSGSTDDSYC